MQFQVTDIQFDFEIQDNVFLHEETQQKVIENTLGVWEADDENDLIEKIIDATGWHIFNVNYEIKSEEI
jgi:hypothetical protein